MNRGEWFLALKICSPVALLAAFYWQDLAAVFTSALVDSATSYLLAVPVLLFYLVYRKRNVISAILRDEFSSQESRMSKLSLTCGILLFATAVFLYFYGSYTFTPLEFHIVTLPIFTAGLLLILFGYSVVRQLAFSLVFMFFLAPPPAVVFYSVGSVLSVVSAHASAALVNALGMPSTVVNNAASPIVVMTKNGQTVASFAVDATCSGIYSLITFLVVTLFLAFLVRDKLWKKFALVAVGLPLIYCLNVLRISTLLIVGFHYGEAAAESLFHSAAGLVVAFAGALLLILIATKLLKANFYSSQFSQTCPSCSSPLDSAHNFCDSCGRLLKKAEAKIAKADAAKVATVAIIVVLLLLVQAPIYALARNQTNVLEQLRLGQDPTTQILPQISGYALRFEFRDTEYEAEVREDAALTYSYTPANSSEDIVWAVVEIAPSESSFHPWEYCLITYPLSLGDQASATQLDLRDIQIMQNPPVTARLFAFNWNNLNTTQVVLYWRENLILTSNDTSIQKSIQISLSIYPSQSERVQQAEDELQKFAAAIAAYWQPIKTWVPIALLLSQYADTLAMITFSVLVIAVSAWYVKETWKNAGGVAYAKIREQDQKIIAALGQTQRSTVSTITNIAATYEVLNKQKIDENELAVRLQAIASLGLTQREIRSVNDEPVLVWKTNYNAVQAKVK